MKFTGPLLTALAALAAPAVAQHTSVSAVAPRPSNLSEVWVVNRGNNSVSVVDVSTETTVAEIDVDVWPRSIAFNPDGSLAFVANQRGNVAVEEHFVTPFDGSEVRGTVSVIDAATRSVLTTLTDVGIEPYGLTVSPNGEWFAVTGHRSGTVKFFDIDAPYAELLTFQYDRSLDTIAPGKTMADVDSNSDFLADLAEPRAMTIRSDSTRIFVTHSTPGFVSVLDLTLDGGGLPTAAVLNTKIDLNTYPFHPINNPVPVQTLASQGVPRFLDDIALSPDGTRALVPHLLHNVNHDVNHTFVGLAGDFANRVYPALTVIDAANLSYAAMGDTSSRLHHELSDPLVPAEYIPYGGKGLEVGGGILTLGGQGAPVLGGTADFVFTGTVPGDIHVLFWSLTAINVPTAMGTILNPAMFVMILPGPSASLNIPNDMALNGMSARFQGGIVNPGGATLKGFTNGIEAVASADAFGLNKMGYRAGHPGRVLYNPDGDRALMLNRGSEDVFLYDVNGSDLELRTVFPPRRNFVPRAGLDASTPLGDLPLGMALVDDPTTSNRDSVLYIVNETTRTLSGLRIDWDANTIAKEFDQQGLLLGPDKMTIPQRLGQEIFEDASRPQTTGNFNNSCTSCHFEGGADGNVWQRPAGPRSTMPVYGGPLLTGLMLWKSVRMNMGETGPMFGGENGGTGLFSDLEQQSLTDYHKIIPVPLNPNIDPVTGDLTAMAALGRDLFFGTDDTGMNPSLRHAGCASCHPDFDDVSMTARGYTSDFISPLFTDGENFGVTADPNCVSLQQNIIAGANIENINSGVNVDVDNDMVIDVDRNGDGFSDIETYVPMNADLDDPFTRDDANSYPCLTNPMDPMSPKKLFDRDELQFSIPTKLGVFSTGPYFHDHSAASLRLLLDPHAQRTDPVYGSPSFNGVQKFFNELHDIRGDESIVPGASKVQVTLRTLAEGSTFAADIEALLAFISSL